MKDLSFNNFTNLINKEIEESNQFEELKRQEKDLTSKIKKVTDEYRKAQNEYVRETDENNTEIAELKKKVKNTALEADSCDEGMLGKQISLKICQIY